MNHLAIDKGCFSYAFTLLSITIPVYKSKISPELQPHEGGNKGNEEDLPWQSESPRRRRWQSRNHRTASHLAASCKSCRPPGHTRGRTVGFVTDS